MKLALIIICLVAMSSLAPILMWIGTGKTIEANETVAQHWERLGERFDTYFRRFWMQIDEELQQVLPSVHARGDYRRRELIDDDGHVLLRAEHSDVTREKIGWGAVQLSLFDRNASLVTGWRLFLRLRSDLAAEWVACPNFRLGRMRRVDATFLKSLTTRAAAMNVSHHSERP